MDSIFDILNNREIATFMWVIVIIVVLLFIRNIRKYILELVKLLFSKQIIVTILLMVIYIGLEILVLYKVGFWDIDIIKETIYWIIGSAFILLVNSKGAFNESVYIKRTIFSSLKLIALIQFIVNLYVFNLIVEIIIIPIVTIIVIMDVYSGSQEKYARIHKVTTGMLAIFGLVMVTISVVNILSNKEAYFILENIRKLFLPFLLMIGYMPFIYMFALYSEYEILFKRIDIFMSNDKEATRYAKIQIFKLCHLNIWKLRRFETKNRNRLLRKNDKESIDAIIRESRDNTKVLN